VFLFDEEGRVVDRLELSAASASPAIMVRISGGLWHMPVPRTEWTAFHEIFIGPFHSARS
jgi:cupin fold WbuC family metalloprotein